MNGTQFIGQLIAKNLMSFKVYNKKLVNNIVLSRE